MLLAVCAMALAKCLRGRGLTAVSRGVFGVATHGIMLVQHGPAQAKIVLCVVSESHAWSAR